MEFQVDSLHPMIPAESTQEQMHLFDRNPRVSCLPEIIETNLAHHRVISMRSRVLKIENDGDFWRKTTKPKIRLKGRWLELAGFKSGNRVHVTCIAPGVIELRSPGFVATDEAKQTPVERPF